jgi:hypothetical protein
MYDVEVFNLKDSAEPQNANSVPPFERGPGQRKPVLNMGAWDCFTITRCYMNAPASLPKPI